MRTFGRRESPGRERDRVQRERSGVKKEWDRATLLRCSLGGLVAGRQPAPAPAPARWAACQSRGIRRAQRRGLARRRQSRGSDLNGAAGPRVPARQGPLKPPPLKQLCAYRHEGEEKPRRLMRPTAGRAQRRSRGGGGGRAAMATGQCPVSGIRFHRRANGCTILLCPCFFSLGSSPCASALGLRRTPMGVCVRVCVFGLFRVAWPHGRDGWMGGWMDGWMDDWMTGLCKEAKMAYTCGVYLGFASMV